MIEEPQMVSAACRGLRHRIASASEIDEIQGQCEANTAMCLSCEDGMVVIDVRYFGEALEMFVWVAVAFKYGAFQRQDAALDQIARELGAKTIAFVSRRRGWARCLGPEWRRRGSTEFVRYVR
jgi:hypothetical protein